MPYPSNTIEYYEGGLHIDDRGSALFVNDFHFEGVKRFYVVRNHRAGFIRAWHGHKKEAKYVTVLQGAAIIGAVRVDNFEEPDKNIAPERFILSAQKPGVLYIPPGYANGSMSFTTDTILLYFSTATLHATKNDDYRFDSHYWNIWKIEER